MATKPSDTYQWGTDGTNDAAPSSGQKLSGWTVGQQPPSSFFNWWQKGIGKWTQYLSDGVLTGAHSVSGALSALSTLSSGALATLHSLAVTNATTLTGALAAAAATFSGLVTANAGVTAGANQHVTVSGTGEFKHGDRVKTMSGIALKGGASWSTPGGILGAESSSNAPGYFAPEFNTGDRLSSITVAFLGNGVADVTLGVQVVTAGNVATTIGSVVVTNPAASVADTTLALTPTTLAAGAVVEVVVSPNASGIQVGNVRITWSHP